MNPTKKTLLVFAIAALTCLPLSAFADAGTPLMWATALHLLFGNVLVGIFEGLILAFAFNLPKIWCVLVMIPANYFSAWAGGFFLDYEITRVLPFNLYNAWHWLGAMVVVTYFLTIVLEWPFVSFCFRKKENWLKKSIQANVLVNSLSYVLLFSWYWQASGTSLYTKMSVVQPSQIDFPKEGVVYYISMTNTVCEFDFRSRQTKSICSLEASKADRLFPRPSVFNTNNWDILDTDKKIMVCSNLEVAASPAPNDTNAVYEAGIMGNMWNFGKAPKLGTADKSDWDFHSGFWGIDGLRGENKRTGETIYFALATPFLIWNIRDAAQLPGDYVVFQMGYDQICLLETNTKKIALLTKGQGPTVVLPKQF